MLKLPRAERREQILASATPVFSRAGHAGASLDDVAAAAGVSRMIIYRHFASKEDLYLAAVRRSAARLAEAVGDELTESTVDAMIGWASAEPDAFRLLFHQAAREPEFRHEVDALRGEMAEEAYRVLAGTIGDPVWTRWAAQLSLTVTIEAIMTWLELGAPGPADAARTRITRAVDAVLQSATPPR